MLRGVRAIPKGQFELQEMGYLNIASFIKIMFKK
jgi:hypothetical protein